MQHIYECGIEHPGEHRASPGVVRSQPELPEMARLTLRHKMFVEAFLANGGNATDAALKAGYSPKNPNVSGYVAHKRPDIKAAIDARREELYATPRVFFVKLVHSSVRAKGRVFLEPARPNS